MRAVLKILILIAAALAGSCTGSRSDYRHAAEDPELLHEAMQKLTDVIIYDIFSPPQASRIYAYSAVAGYEALSAGRYDYRSLAGQLNGLHPVPAPDEGAEHDLSVASVHALLTVGRALTFSEGAMEDYIAQVHARFRQMGVPRAVLERSIAYGDRVASHVLAWADQDHYRETRSAPRYTVTDEPGRWKPTPPGYMGGIEPSWGTIRPFTMESGEQFLPSAPYPFDMTPGSPFYREALQVYEVAQALSPEQKEIAAFWDCNPYVLHLQGHAMFATKKMTPGGHWMGIAAIASRTASADMMPSLEAYVHTAVALADAFISSWAEKYRSSLIRPETVINRYLDPDWTPLLQTPPFPEYTSGHSVASAAASHVLTALFGQPFAYVDTTEVRFGLPARSYASFTEAAEEAAISRLYAGIHYMQAIREGFAQGQRVGAHVRSRLETRSGSIAAMADPA